MNERIEELVKQACKELADAGNSTDIALTLFPEKFAELIIRECAKVALDEAHDSYECILSHFGIE